MKRAVVFNNSSTESNRIQSTFLILKKRLKNATLIEWDVLKKQQGAMEGPQTSIWCLCTETWRRPVSLTLSFPHTQPVYLWVQLWLPAMKAKGLEISGTFARRGGIIQMDLSLNNKAMSVMTDFAIQFNRNRWVQHKTVLEVSSRFCSSLCGIFSDC